MENFFGLLKVEYFKQELLDYYNNRRIKAKRKGLPPAIHRQQTLSAAGTIFDRKILSNFLGALQFDFRPVFIIN